MIARVLVAGLLTLSAATVESMAQQQPPAVNPPPGPQRRNDPPPQPPNVLVTPSQPPNVLVKPPQPPNVQVAPAPRREGQPFNVKVDVTISEQNGTAPPLRKTVTVVAGEGTLGFVRSQATFGGIPTPLNVDVEPVVAADGKIRLGLGVQYDVPAPPAVADSSTGRGPDPQTVRSALGNLTRTEIRQNLRVVLENGKPLVVSQSADPVSDRKVTLEVTATILK